MRTYAQKLHQTACERAGTDDNHARWLAEEHGIRFITPHHEEWPEQLNDLHLLDIGEVGGAPIALWARGGAVSTGPAVCLVGSRASTAYGDRVAADLATGLAEAGLAIVTTPSYGIDAAVARGVLAADRGAQLVLVAASGLETAYPRAHADLIEQVVASGGCLLTEVPPGVSPTRARFLDRARILAGLSTGTVVVEAGIRAGARRTADWTTALQRPLMAVPGTIHSATSHLPHQLIREGHAALVAFTTDVLTTLEGAQS
ncbi:DNA-processing protein DprA [Corynebacterium sp. H78]|uniref:DNA-processing protein DprA n=1 Tax=Corynebacterium sp. H78 TaxID=3133417 RepID=UPI00309FE74A